jgi:hypothetical protein
MAEKIKMSKMARALPVVLMLLVLRIPVLFRSAAKIFLSFLLNACKDHINNY